MAKRGIERKTGDVPTRDCKTPFVWQRQVMGNTDLTPHQRTVLWHLGDKTRNNTGSGARTGIQTLVDLSGVGYRVAKEALRAGRTVGFLRVEREPLGQPVEYHLTLPAGTPTLPGEPGYVPLAKRATSTPAAGTVTAAPVEARPTPPRQRAPKVNVTPTVVEPTAARTRAELALTDPVLAFVGGPRAPYPDDLIPPVDSAPYAMALVQCAEATGRSVESLAATNYAGGPVADVLAAVERFGSMVM